MPRSWPLASSRVCLALPALVGAWLMGPGQAPTAKVTAAEAASTTVAELSGSADDAAIVARIDELIEQGWQDNGLRPAKAATGCPAAAMLSRAFPRWARVLEMCKTTSTPPSPTC